MCSAKATAPADLVRHLKIHGLKLYQCCWCIHGADNESELLAHASAYHPTKLPKAYLRIITNKVFVIMPKEILVIIMFNLHFKILLNFPTTFSRTGYLI